MRLRFEPGTLLASRYRIISRLGKGGMGEVFRPDDIMLGQPVALKFPSTTRCVSREITHANVCRVYDMPYLSMEYIDGEDLGSLLRRIGRLPSDKARPRIVIRSVVPIPSRDREGAVMAGFFHTFLKRSKRSFRIYHPRGGKRKPLVY